MLHKYFNWDTCCSDNCLRRGFSSLFTVFLSFSILSLRREIKLNLAIETKEFFLYFLFYLLDTYIENLPHGAKTVKKKYLTPYKTFIVKIYCKKEYGSKVRLKSMIAGCWLWLTTFYSSLINKVFGSITAQQSLMKRNFSTLICLTKWPLQPNNIIFSAVLPW